MSEIKPCGDQQDLAAAVAEAAEVVGRGECIVLPTDTVYGIGCDAFSAAGVQGLLGAKGRTREMPPPVLIARPEVMDALADQVSQDARALAAAFWPGALTLVCWAQPTLGWDLGETHGTVALRVPDDDVTRAVLDRVGPMAVSSANRTGMPAARTALAAQEMLQDRVPLYLDAGPRPVGHAAEGAQDVASTIVDCTGETPVVLRHGAITLEQLREVVPCVHGGASDGERGGDHDTAPPAESGSRQPGTDSVSTAQSGASDAARRDDAPEQTATGTSAGPDAAASVPERPLPADTSDAELITAMVQEAGPATQRPVDQHRERELRREPRWRGTSALSMEDAERLVSE